MTRKTVVWSALLAIAAIIAVVAFVFQPQKLFIDKRVDETAPVAAVLAAAATSAPAPDSVVASLPPAPTVSAAPSATQSAKAPASAAASKAAVPHAVTPAAPAPVAAGRGEFRGLSHPGSGTAALLKVGAGYVVRFENLNVENGPDLRVYLSTASSGSKQSAFNDEYVDIGSLKGNKGNQNYRVGASVDVRKYRSVVVWCRRFSVGFAVAPLT